MLHYTSSVCVEIMLTCITRYFSKVSGDFYYVTEIHTFPHQIFLVMPSSKVVIFCCFWVFNKLPLSAKKTRKGAGGLNNWVGWRFPGYLIIAVVDCWIESGVWEKINKRGTFIWHSKVSSSLSHGSEYHITNIFEENIGYIMRDNRSRTSLSLTYEISTVC